MCFRACHPATILYSNTIDVLSHHYYHFLEAIAETISFVSRMVTGEMQSFTETGQSRNVHSTSNYASTTSSVPQILPTIKRSLLKIKSELKQLSRQSPQVSKQNSNQRKTSEESIVAEIPPRVVSADDGSCRLCVEKGKVCIRGCPKAKDQ
ncbi:hypothetical protein K1T71_006439 [Dendrolimus kikuchii]|uniref:Uncharacterized protein n=1 Tax=Dendrolimus kikuchii TaxID=765133 RepID=A0ACC1D131_9NEOP|nr:hypothetical protein K1T71_006439 [Dendrolimus kikuchii]